MIILLSFCIGSKLNSLADLQFDSYECHVFLCHGSLKKAYTMFFLMDRN